MKYEGTFWDITQFVQCSLKFCKTEIWSCPPKPKNLNWTKFSLVLFLHPNKFKKTQRSQFEIYLHQETGVHMLANISVIQNWVTHTSSSNCPKRLGLFEKQLQPGYNPEITLLTRFVKCCLESLKISTMLKTFQSSSMFFMGAVPFVSSRRGLCCRSRTSLFDTS